jgi:hypothetical protein
MWAGAGAASAGHMCWSFLPSPGHGKAVCPSRFSRSSWFLPVAEVRQGPAPVEHEPLAIGPRRDRPAIGVEEHAEQAHLVHADDPLTPRQVLDRVSSVGPFPVQDSGDLQGGRLEPDILRP